MNSSDNKPSTYSFLLAIMFLASALFLFFLILVSRKKITRTSLTKLRQVVYGLLPEELE